MPSLSRFAAGVAVHELLYLLLEEGSGVLQIASECISFGKPYIIPFLTQQPFSGVSLVLLNWKSVG